MSSYVCLVLLIAIAGELVGRHQSTAITVDEHPTLPANLSHLLTMVGSDELRKLLQDTSFTECVKVSFALQSKKSNKFLRAKKKGAVDARGRSWRPRGGTVVFAQVLEWSGFTDLLCITMEFTKKS